MNMYGLDRALYVWRMARARVGTKHGPKPETLERLGREMRRECLAVALQRPPTDVDLRYMRGEDDAD